MSTCILRNFFLKFGGTMLYCPIPVLKFGLPSDLLYSNVSLHKLRTKMDVISWQDSSTKAYMPVTKISGKWRCLRRPEFGHCSLSNTSNQTYLDFFVSTAFSLHGNRTILPKFKWFVAVHKKYFYFHLMRKEKMEKEERKENTISQNLDFESESRNLLSGKCERKFLNCTNLVFL